MVKDVKNGMCHRADKVIEDHIDKVMAKSKNMKQDEKDKLLRIQADAGAMKAP